MNFLNFNGSNSINPSTNIGGIVVFKGFLLESDQNQIVEDLRQVVKQAPTFSPKTRFGKKMSVRLTAAGDFGWYSD